VPHKYSGTLTCLLYVVHAQNFGRLTSGSNPEAPVLAGFHQKGHLSTPYLTGINNLSPQPHLYFFHIVYYSPHIITMSNPEQAERRRAQNRIAQRAYRKYIVILPTTTLYPVIYANIPVQVGG
jgi:hypothetical protein